MTIASAIALHQSSNQYYQANGIPINPLIFNNIEVTSDNVLEQDHNAG